MDHARGRPARQPRAADRARQSGRQPCGKCPDAAHLAGGGDAGPQPRAGAGDLRRHGASPPPRRRRGRADPGPLPAELAEPGGRPGHEGHLRAAPPAFPRSRGDVPRRGRPRGSPRSRPTQLRRFCEATYRPNGAILGVAGAIDWPRLRDARRPVVRRLEAAARAAGPGTARRPAPRSYPARDPADPDRAGLSRGDRRQPRLLPRHAPPPRSWAVIPRPGSSPKSARNAGCATPSTPATKVSSIAPPCSATPALRPTGRSKPST